MKFISFIKYLYSYSLIWLHTRSLKKELDSELKVYESLKYSYFYGDKEVERKYMEGISKVKAKIKEAAGTGGKRNYESALSAIGELIHLAKEETPQQKALRKMLEKMYVRYGGDIKNTKDKSDMIDTRIAHYEELRLYNEKRKIIKEIKTLRKEGKVEEASTLETKWKDKYEKRR